MRHRTPTPTRWILPFALSVAVAVPATATSYKVAAESFPLAAAQTVRIDFPVGELDVVGTTGDRVTVAIEARCDRSSARCERNARDVRLETRSSHTRLELQIEGFSAWRTDDLSLHGTIEVPRGAAVVVDMGVGRLLIEDIRGDLTADLGVGELEIVTSEASFASAMLDAGIGETTLRTADGRKHGRRSFLLGSEFRWRAGDGHAALRAEVGVGEVTVRLD